MKRYALFEFEQYYPGGGFNDFVDSFDSVEVAVNFYRSPRPRAGMNYDSYVTEHFQVVDLSSGEVVEEE